VAVAEGSRARPKRVLGEGGEQRASLAIDCVGGINCLNVVITPNLAVRVWRRACAALTAGANVSARYSRKILNRRRHRSERDVRLFRCGLERFCQQILVAD